MPRLRGTEHPSHKLTEQDVREIRASYDPGWVGYRELAEQYGVSFQLIARVVNRTTWEWVTD